MLRDTTLAIPNQTDFQLRLHQILEYHLVDQTEYESAKMSGCFEIKLELKCIEAKQNKKEGLVVC